MAHTLAPAVQVEKCSGSSSSTLQQIKEVIETVGPVAKRKDKLMKLSDFCRLMRSANEQQKDLLVHILNNILKVHSRPLQLFITGPAGCGKTFIVRHIKEIYNRFAENHGLFNSYIACASTSKASLAIDGVTVCSAFKIIGGQLVPLTNEVARHYRILFKDIKVIIIDEVNMIGAALLNKIDIRLKQITGNFNVNFGGLDIILIGDLRQLPPINDIFIYKLSPLQLKLEKPFIWRDLKFFELTQSVRQDNQAFAQLLSKIGNGEILNQEEIALIESRFFTREEADRLCPDGIHLFEKVSQVDIHNIAVANRAKTIHQAQGDTFDRVVYHYNKKHRLPLVYVALSRVKTLEGLFIVTYNDDLHFVDNEDFYQVNEDDLHFYHCQKNDNCSISLKHELERLALNTLTTIDATVKADLIEKLFTITFNENDN